MRVRTEQKGLYTVLITNEDDAKEVTFALEVQGRKLISLKDRLRYPFLLPGFYLFLRILTELDFSEVSNMAKNLHSIEITCH